MATRATLTVTDDRESFDIYRHHDGYPHGPHGVVQDVKAAISQAWTPKFQASDLGAAIVARMKTAPGSVYLTQNANLHSDREYHYELTGSKSDVLICVQHVSYRTRKLVTEFKGPLDAAVQKYNATPHPRFEVSKDGAELITASLKQVARLLAEQSQNPDAVHCILQIKMALAVLS